MVLTSHCRQRAFLEVALHVSPKMFWCLCTTFFFCTVGVKHKVSFIDTFINSENQRTIDHLLYEVFPFNFVLSLSS